MPENAICMILNKYVNTLESEERNKFVAELNQYAKDDNVPEFVRDNINAFIVYYLSPVDENGNLDQELANERSEAFKKLTTVLNPNIDKVKKGNGKQEKENEQASNVKSQPTAEQKKKKSVRSAPVSRSASNQFEEQKEEESAKKRAEEELLKKRNTESYDASTHHESSQNKTSKSILERLMEWLKLNLEKEELKKAQIQNIFEFMDGLDQTGKNERGKDSTKFKLKVLRDDTVVNNNKAAFKMHLDEAMTKFKELCDSENDKISSEQFKHASAAKKKLKEFFDTCYEYENGNYVFKGGNLGEITEKAKTTCAALEDYLDNRKPKLREKIFRTSKMKRYPAIENIYLALKKMLVLDLSIPVDWNSYSLNAKSKLMYDGSDEERYNRWLASENEKEQEKRSPHIKNAKVKKGKLTEKSRRQLIERFNKTLKTYSDEPEEKEEKKTEEKIEEENKMENIRKKDKWEDLTRDEIKKIRKENAEREFYGGYEKFLNIQDDPEKKQNALRLVNSNDPNLLKQWLDEKIDNAAADDVTNKLRGYVNYRIGKLNEINEVVKNAEKNMQNHEVGQFQTIDGGNGSKTYRVANVNQSEIQTTSNGCWSVALSTMLEHRGVKLDQSQIRAYRPDVDSFPNDIEFANQDKPNSIHAYTDLIQSVLPNTAVNSASYFSRPNADNPLTENQKEQELKKVATTMNEVIQHAMEKGKGPVALLVGNHYRTIYELKDNNGDVTVKFCDPEESKPQEMKLEELAKKAYAFNEKINDDNSGTVLSEERYCFEVQWLEDLKNGKGEVELDEELKEKIEYGQDGKLSLKDGAKSMDKSWCHVCIENKEFSSDCSHSTYLPQKLIDIQKNKEKTTDSRKLVKFSELKVSKNDNIEIISANKKKSIFKKTATTELQIPRTEPAHTK